MWTVWPVPEPTLGSWAGSLQIPPVNNEDEDDLEHFWDLDDVSDVTMEPVEREEPDHDSRTNDENKGKIVNNLVMDDEYLASPKTVWPVPEPGSEDYVFVFHPVYLWDQLTYHQMIL